jgi:cardiolipin synthase A/B
MSAQSIILSLIGIHTSGEPIFREQGWVQMKFTFILLFLITLWFIIDFHLGRKKHLSKVKKNDSPIYHGHFDIFPHGRELFADYFQELKRAKHHIHVLFYILKDDAISHEFLHILEEKVKEGVEVRLLIDRIGSYKVKKKEVNELRKKGIQFAFSNQIKFPFPFYSSQVRNHRKISIIDGVIGYLGGFNIGKEYIDLDPKLSPWRDYHLKIIGESVPFLQRMFLQDWFENTKVDLQSLFYFPEQREKGIVPHQFSATEGFFLEESFIKLIQNAKESITIGTPYFIPSKKVFERLIEALNRGVKLDVIVPYAADHILVQEASYRYLRRLIKEGANIFQFNNGFYHAKTLIIDNQICDIGTANFDKRSLFLNKEINCYFYSADFTKRLMDIIRKDIQDSRPLVLEDLTKPNFLRSVKEGIAGVVSFFL